MNRRCALRWLGPMVAIVGVVLPVGLLLAVDPPAPPAASRWAPAADLDAQVRLYLADFETALADESSFADKQDRIRKDAHTLAVVAQTLGLHDTASEFQASAPALVKAAQDLAAAEDVAGAQA